MVADALIWDAVKKSSVVREGASEEDPIVRDVDEGGEGEFTVCWDPLDGSSIVDNNWAVGTMMGIWPKSTGLLGAKGSDQVTSLIALYGPRTTVLIALDDGAYEFSYGCTPEGCQLPDGSFEPWICSKTKIQISEESKIFSPANLRAAQDVPGYKKLVDHFMDNRYTLRCKCNITEQNICNLSTVKNPGTQLSLLRHREDFTGSSLKIFWSLSPYFVY